jgi:hypothetical protein
MQIDYGRLSGLARRRGLIPVEAIMLSTVSCGESGEREIENTFYNNNRESYRIIEGRKTERKAVD